MAVTINEKIRYYKANDPYYYEVDNLPLLDLLDNDKSLRDAINEILLNNQNWATAGYVDTRVQTALGDSGIININGDGDLLPTNVVDWVISKNYITLDDVVDGTDDLVIPKKLSHLHDVVVLGSTVTEGDILAYDPTVLQSNNTDYGVFVNKPPGEVPGIPGTSYLTNRYFIQGQEKAATVGSEGHHLMNARTLALNSHNSLESDHLYHYASNVNGYSKGMYFVRSFQDMGIPENAKKILFKYGVNFGCGTTVQNSDSHLHLDHPHSSFSPGKMEVIDRNPNRTNLTSAFHRWEGLLLKTAEKTGSYQNTMEDLEDLTLHYGNPIKHPEDPTKNLLVFHQAILGHTAFFSMFLYVYGYET
tara:strand:+ start:579 stop:1658 length:1080 start_codon:yes stop_codon:yes gene_type:complete